MPEWNGVYLIRPAYKYPQNRILHQAGDARRNEKIVGGRDAAIELQGRIYCVFFHCA
jgi:hypothetical protein